MSLSTKHSSRIPSIGSVYFVGSDENNTGSAASPWGDISIVVAGSVILFSNYFELFLTLSTLNNLVNSSIGFNQSLFVFWLFVLFEGLQCGYKYFLDKFGNLDASVSRELPPCPSNTPKIELPPPMSSYDIAASSIFLRQPVYYVDYPAFRNERIVVWVWDFRLCMKFFRGWVVLNRDPL